MRFTVHDEGDSTVLTVDGAVDGATVGDFRDHVGRLVDSPRPLVIDLAQVTVLDAVALGVLVGANRRAGRVGNRMSLRNLPPHVLALLRRTRLDAVLNIGSAA